MSRARIQDEIARDTLTPDAVHVLRAAIHDDTMLTDTVRAILGRYDHRMQIYFIGPEKTRLLDIASAIRVWRKFFRND